MRGSREIKEKNRITLLLCTNIDGSCKFPPTNVSKGKNPYCSVPEVEAAFFLTIVKINSRMDSKIILICFKEVFFSHVRRYLTEKVALMLDNARSHDDKIIENPKDPHDQIGIVVLLRTVLQLISLLIWSSLPR